MYLLMYLCMFVGGCAYVCVCNSACVPLCVSLDVQFYVNSGVISSLFIGFAEAREAESFIYDGVSTGTVW